MGKVIYLPPTSICCSFCLTFCKSLLIVILMIKWIWNIYCIPFGLTICVFSVFARVYFNVEIRPSIKCLGFQVVVVFFIFIMPEYNLRL